MLSSARMLVHSRTKTATSAFQALRGELKPLSPDPISHKLQGVVNTPIIHLSTHPTSTSTSVYPSIHPPAPTSLLQTFHPLIHSSIHSLIPPPIHLPTRSSKVPSIHPLTNPYFHQFNRPTSHLSIHHPSILLVIHPPIDLPTHPPFHLFTIYPSIQSFISPLTHPSIQLLYSYIHLSTCLPNHTSIHPLLVLRSVLYCCSSDFSLCSTSDVLHTVQRFHI